VMKISTRLNSCLCFTSIVGSGAFYPVPIQLNLRSLSQSAELSLWDYDYY